MKRDDLIQYLGRARQLLKYSDLHSSSNGPYLCNMLLHTTVTAEEKTMFRQLEKQIEEQLEIALRRRSSRLTYDTFCKLNGIHDKHRFKAGRLLWLDQIEDALLNDKPFPPPPLPPK